MDRRRIRKEGREAVSWFGSERFALLCLALVGRTDDDGLCELMCPTHVSCL